MPERETQWLARVFGALSNENRLRMFQRLQLKAIECNAQDGCCDFSDRCCNLSELAADLSISQATASHHLKELSRNGLVETRRNGRYVHCARSTTKPSSACARFSARECPASPQWTRISLARAATIEPESLNDKILLLSAIQHAQ